jgi:hypothetical protein
MKTHSCGAILYTIYEGNICIVLGMEKGEWFPFKGTKEMGESNMQTAIREIKEETCDTVHINYIDLCCHFSTKRKHYHIGLVGMTTEEYNNFNVNRESFLKDDNKVYLEKTAIKRFPICTIFENEFHIITLKAIRYYYEYLVNLQRKINTDSIKCVEDLKDLPIHNNYRKQVVRRYFKPIRMP